MKHRGTDERGNDFIDHARSPGDRSGGDAVGVPRIARHHRGSPGRNWVDPALQNVPSLSGQADAGMAQQRAPAMNSTTTPNGRYFMSKGSRFRPRRVALGERGPVWWEDGSLDLNRHRVENTRYAQWYRLLFQ